MKKTTIIFLSLLLSFGWLSAQFEGKVTMSPSEKDGDIVFFVKGDQVKMSPDINGKTADIYMNGSNSEMTMIVEDAGEKFGMKFSLGENSMIGMQMKMQMQQMETEEIDFKKTSETKTIDGYKCTLYTAKRDNGESVKAWLTDELEFGFEQLFPIQSPMTEQIKQSLLANGMTGFPLEMTKIDKDGKESTMRTKVEEMSLKNVEFEPGSNVDVMDMDLMIQEMMAAQNDPEKMQEIQQKMERFQKAMGGN
jgi:hypothetical protein